MIHFSHIGGVTVKAQFAVEGGIRYRYRLEVSLKDPRGAQQTACVVMQNPSYAGEQQADKSVQFMEKVVFQKGLEEFKSVRRLIVVNQFAKIQTNTFKGLPNEIGKENNSAIQTALSESDIVILGWGCSNRFEERKAFVLDLLKTMTCKAIFKTRMHPSRGRYEGFIQPISRIE